MSEARWPGRQGFRWRQTVLWFKENVPWVCMRCGGDIPKDVDHQKDPLGYTLDHKIPLVEILKRQGDPLDKENLEPMHRRCNSSKGTREGVDPVNVSRQW